MGLTHEYVLETVVEGVSEEMIQITNDKFKYWDNVLKNNLLVTGTEEEKKEIYLKLRDPTIYAYAFFKNPKNIRKKLKLYPYQD